MRYKELGGSITIEVTTTTTTTSTNSESVVTTQWLHDGEPVVMGNKYDTTGSTAKRHLLNIRDISARDAGDYTFVVGGRNTTGRLSVEYKPQFVNAGTSVYKVRLSIISFLFHLILIFNSYFKSK